MSEAISSEALMRFIGATPEQRAAIDRFLLGAEANGDVVLGGPLYRLHQGRRAWELTFAGRRDVLGDELGLHYVRALLYGPPRSPVNVLELAARVAGVPVLQERNLEAPARADVDRLLSEARELSAVLSAEGSSALEREEAERELEALERTLSALRRKTRAGASQRAATVRLAIRRLVNGLNAAVDEAGEPHPVFVPFAEHLEACLLVPSTRFANRPGGAQRAGTAGELVYEPTTGVVWGHKANASGRKSATTRFVARAT